MPTYIYCSQALESNVPLPELPHSLIEKAKLFFVLKCPTEQVVDQPWFYHWLSASGEKILSYRKHDSYHWLRFPGSADFKISIEANEVSCYPLPEIPIETIRHLLLDQVLPRCLAHRRKIMLHASAVQLERGLLLFVGNSGAGKSTLAGSFHQMGNPVIADDCVWVKEDKEQIVAIPSYGGLRLWEDSLRVLFNIEQDLHPMAHYTSKKRVRLKRNDLPTVNNMFPILSVIELFPEFQSSNLDIRLDQMSLREAFIEIANETFQLDSYDRNERSSHMQILASIVKKVPVLRLSIPRDYKMLPIVRQKILETVL